MYFDSPPQDILTETLNVVIIATVLDRLSLVPRCGCCAFIDRNVSLLVRVSPLPRRCTERCFLARVLTRLPATRRARVALSAQVAVVREDR